MMLSRDATSKGDWLNSIASAVLSKHAASRRHKWISGGSPDEWPLIHLLQYAVVLLDIGDIKFGRMFDGGRDSAVGVEV